MNVIKDCLGQIIKVGDVVIQANSNYMKHDLSIVIKLGNAKNCKTSKWGSFVDCSGIVVINDMLDTLPHETKKEIEKLIEENKDKLDHSRPKRSNTIKHLCMINRTNNSAMVVSGTEKECYDKIKAFKDSCITLSGKYILRRGSTWSRSAYFQCCTFVGTKAETFLSLKSIKELGIEKEIDNLSGFNYTNYPEFMAKIGIN